MVLFAIMIFLFIKNLPSFLSYYIYDKINYKFYRLHLLFYGWGIHLYTGRFGRGKTISMVVRAYKLCLKYPQLTILTNLTLINFPSHTKILKLTTAKDILNAPNDTIVLIDEIGTIFNSRDFSSGKNAVPKPLFQHLCQCRHRRMMILATVQRFNLLDKQIRDICATVTVCKGSFSHPFTRLITLRQYDIEEYELYIENRTYTPKLQNFSSFIQKEKYRNLYDTHEMVNGMMDKEYLSDVEIMENRGEIQSIFGNKEQNKMTKHRKKY